MGGRGHRPPRSQQDPARRRRRGFPRRPARCARVSGRAPRGRGDRLRAGRRLPRPRRLTTRHAQHRHNGDEREDHDDRARGPLAQRGRPALDDGGKHRPAGDRPRHGERALSMDQSRSLIVPAP